MVSHLHTFVIYLIFKPNGLRQKLNFSLAKVLTNMNQCSSTKVDDLIIQSNYTFQGDYTLCIFCSSLVFSCFHGLLFVYYPTVNFLLLFTQTPQITKL
jgi:hypothetical protein